MVMCIKMWAGMVAQINQVTLFYSSVGISEMVMPGMEDE